MYLKSLEIQGFKSFPDKTVLNFNKGITAVVGPNGSGKSNIGDAMRWVMGEKSSKALRGDKMSGVIFHGTQSRPKSAFAQVTITIDNEDGALDYDSDLVSVSRKLYRNGDSEYMINSNNVRLKDITELFLDTGLGNDGYSIIGQGMITDIVKGKSGERREIFEQAAGIGKFRYKKEEAERKLEAAEENISRLNDILGELESRIGPLKNQCEKAKKFRTLDDEKRKLEVSLWVKKMEDCMSSINDYTEKLKSLEEQYNALSKELEGDENEIEENLRKSAEKSDEIDRLKNEIHSCALESAKADSDIAVFENDIAHLEEDIALLNEKAEQLGQSKYYLDSELEKRKNDYEAYLIKQENFRKAIAEKEKALKEISSQTEEFDKNSKESADEINNLYLTRSELNFKIENGKNNIDEAGVKLTGYEEEFLSLNGDKALGESQLEKLEKNRMENEELYAETVNRLQGMNKLLEVKSSKLLQVENKLKEGDISLSRVKNKLQILRDLENSMEGFAYSVKHIMKAAKQGRVSGICGTVAGLVKIDQQYSAAIETALGGALQNIVTENEESAKRAIKLLKENRAGRATFLPITAVRGNRLEISSLKNEVGFVSVACDLVEFEDKFKGIITSLLGRICVAENIDMAANIAKKYGYKFRIVTLDGQVINAGGSFTGGSLSKNTGLLTRKNEIETLAKQESSLEEVLSQLREKKVSLEQETAKMSTEAEGISARLNSLNGEKIRLETEAKNLKETLERFEENFDNIKSQIESVKTKIAEENSALNENIRRLEEVNQKIEVSESELSAVQDKSNRLREQRERISGELADMRVKNAEILKDTQACQMSVEQLEKSISSGESDGEKLQSDIVNKRSEIQDKKNKICEIKNKISGSSQVVKEYECRIEIARKEHLDFDAEAEYIRRRIKTKTDEKQNLSEQIIRGQERKKGIADTYDKLASNLWDEYELTRTDAQSQAENLPDITAANKRLAELKGQIKALGHVNLGAIEEYAEVSERYEFLNGQLTDVTTSKRELEELICDLTENMKNIFTTCFEKINSNFKEIFSELFGGGKGELSLTDPENVLECGIDINVQPPGKVITNLLSLSGGEQSLVAVAIYFSILKISPSPFCLLDEIEAALDDVNVTRYARYLHNLTDKTQFIAITHRRGTMEEADVLYGVTMQEKGISKLLKMDVQDTAQMKFET